MKRLCSLVLILISGANCAFGQIPVPASAPPSRIAIISNAETTNLAALLTTELSNNPAIILVERDDLAKVGDESRLQQLAGSDPVSLGKLIGADGLVFISRSSDGIQVRFTAAGLGYALFDDRYQADSDLQHLAQTIAQRVTDYAPKLKLRPEDAIPISILNLRADVAMYGSSDTERKLTLLLESRLAAVPRYVILERRHISAIKFERVLSNNSQSLMQGVSVIDGTLTLPSGGKDDVTVHLRLRPTGGQSVLLELHGSSKDLPALAMAMATEIGKKMGAAIDPAAWQPKNEAREYLLEGIWGSQHDANETALEALDSAELLGENLADIVSVRVPVLCALTVGSSQICRGDETTPDDPHPETRIEALLRAFEEETHYEAEDMASKLQTSHPDPSTLGNLRIRRAMMFRTATSLLKMLDSTPPSKGEDVRSAFRAFAGYDPLHGKFPEDPWESVRAADSLSRSLDEEKAYYCTFFESSANTSGWRQMRLNLSLHTFGTRFFSEPEKGHTAYLDFLKSMFDGPGRLSALLGYAEAISPKDLQQEACNTLYQTLTDQRDALFADNQLVPYLSAAFELESSREVKEADPRLVTLEHFILQHVGQIDPLVSQTWHPEVFPAAEAPVLWNEFLALEAKSPGNTPYITNMRRNYLQRFGNPDSGAAALTVSRFWIPPEAPGKFHFASYPLIAVNDGVWAAVSFSEGKFFTTFLYHIALDGSHPDTFTTKVFQIPDFYPQSMAITSDAMYLLGSHPPEWQQSIIQQLDPTTGHFEIYEVPTTRQIFEVGGKIYLALSGKGLKDMESGIVLLDGKTHATTVLASSRRRPAQNQFDDRENYTVNTLFSGPGGKPWASIGFGEIYAMDEKNGDWPMVIPSGSLSFSKTEGTRTLLYGMRLTRERGPNTNVVFMVDSTKTNPELWLGASAPLYGTKTSGQQGDLPTQTGWSVHPLWEEPIGNGPGETSFGFRGDDLFSFVSHTNTQEKELLWYRRGQTAPVHIPLNFKMDEEASDSIKAMETAERDPDEKEGKPDNTPLRMFCAPQGLCFIASGKGFYFLSFGEIDDFLKNHPSPPASR